MKLPFVLLAPTSRGTPQVLAYAEAVCISSLSSGWESWEVQQQLLLWALTGRLGDFPFLSTEIT